MLPKEPEPEPQVEPEPVAQVPVSQAPSLQPDVIPTQRESIQSVQSVQSENFEPVAPPEQFGNQNGTHVENVPEIVQDVPNQVTANESIYSNIDYIQQEQANQAQAEAEQVNAAALAGNDDCDLSEYIEDTKIQAIALYDYQASAEDEISFDPNDIITHIEKVCAVLMVQKDSNSHDTSAF